jgi:phosphatidylserine/phosphatidylglycerophosphate/cardiolipin synthase-like enzyme
VDQGAEVYSYEGLHSKVAVFDNKALIGSANLSENACVTTCEAVLLTDDPQVAALIQGFVEKVKNEADEVNEDFLKRIESLPVIRGGGWGRKSKKKIEVGESRVWLISTVPLSDKVVKAEEQFVEAGTKEAEQHLKNRDNELEPIRWVGKSRFRSQAKAGDLIIQVFTERRGKRKYIEVHRHAPIRHRQDEGNWTRFYVEVPKEQVWYRWKDIEADFKSLGVTNITPNSTRELTGKALGILQLMQ